MGLAVRLKNICITVWYMLCTLPFIWWCVFWNLAGLLLCMGIGSPILFFDMTGTAIASLSRGLGYGVVVALTSNLVGALLLPPLIGFNPEVYIWFGFTNAIGAVVWALAPRAIVYAQARLNKPHKDFFSTDASKIGYRTLLYQIVLVGVIAGIIVGLFALFTQRLALGCTIENQMKLCVETSPAFRSGYIISTFFHSGGGYDWLLPAVSLILFDILDKIVATASAMMIIFIFHRVPNYNAQSAKLQEFRSRGLRPGSFAVAAVSYVMSLSFFAILYAFVLFDRSQPWGAGQVTVYAVSFIVLLVFLRTTRFVPLYNLFHRNDDETRRFYHDKSLISQQSTHRDVFEDILKTVVIIVTVGNLLLQRLQSKLAAQDQLVRDRGGLNVSLEVFPTQDGYLAAGPTFISLAAPIVFLNLWRYFIVFLARYWGTIYKDAEPVQLSSGALRTLTPVMRGVGILLLLLLLGYTWTHY